MSTYINGTITNGVVLSGTQQNPVTIAASGYVTNNTASHSGDAIYGSPAAAWNIVNSGTIAATDFSYLGSSGVYLNAGGTVSNAVGALIVSGGNGVVITGSNSTITNAGTIEATGIGGAGVAVRGSNSTITNTGTIEANQYFGLGYGISLAAMPGASVTNAQGALISGERAGVASGASAVITNFGTIVGLKPGFPGGPNPDDEPVVGGLGIALSAQSAGVVVNGSTNVTSALISGPGGGISGLATITNFGTIQGGGYPGTGVNLYSGSVLANAASGVIRGVSGVLFESGSGTSIGTINNCGVIAGTAGVGISVGQNRSVNVIDTRRIINNQTGTIVGSSYGIKILGNGTVINYGRIAGIATGSTTGTGVVVGGGFGTNVDGGATIVNGVGGYIEGSTGVVIGGTAGIIVNAGTIVGQGGTAVSFAAGSDQLVIEQGSSLQGVVGNFHPGDTFDLPFMSFSNSGTVTLAANNVLQITENGSIFNIDLDPAQNFAGDVFSLASDGSNGTLILEKQNSASGSKLAFFAGSQTVNIALTPDGTNLAAPVAGDFNIEVFDATAGSPATGYQGSAFLPGATAISGDNNEVQSGTASEQLLAGSYTVIDRTDQESLQIVGNPAGGSSITVIGSLGDTIIGSTIAGNAQLIEAIPNGDAIAGPMTVIGGGGATTVWGGANDSITGGAGAMLVDGHPATAGGFGASDTIAGGAGNMTVFGAAGDSIAGGAGALSVNESQGHSGLEKIAGGAGSLTVFDLGRNDTISGSIGGTTLFGGSAGGTTFIDDSYGSGGFSHITGGSGTAGTLADGETPSSRPLPATRFSAAWT
jgi:hypothetical protein